MILTRYVFAEILRTFLAALLVFSMIFLIAGVYELVRQTVSLRQIAVVVPYILVYTMPFLLPVALLVGCTLAYGRLAADNEILPVVSGGIPVTRLAAPAILLGIFLTGLLYGLQGSLIPYGYMKKKDLVRAYLEQLTNLGEATDVRIDDEESFHFYCRVAHGQTVEGVEIVYEPRRGAERPLGLGQATGGGGDGRPTEIVAARGRVERDAARDSVVLRLEDVEFTEWNAAPASGTARPADDDLPPRGRPDHGRLRVAEIEIPISRRSMDATEFRSSAFLAAYIARLDAFVRFARDPEAAAAAETGAAASLAGSGATPGAGAGALGGGLASVAALGPTPRSLADAKELAREARGFIHGRVSLALAPLLFAIIGAAVPLRLRHNNRLLPFLVAFALVAVVYFLPWLSARNLIDEDRGPGGLLYYVAPALTLAVGLALHLDLRRR